MSSLSEAKQLAREGRFLEALSTLNAGGAERNRRVELEVLRVELLERVGSYAAARTQADELLHLKTLSKAERSACEQVIGRAYLASGRFSDAVVSLQRAAGLALEVHDFSRASWAQMWLLVAIADRSGPNAAVSLLAELRTNAIRSADPLILASLHLFVAQMEAMRKMLAGARRHLQLARQALETFPNVWLSAIAENIEVAISTLRADFKDALARSPRAIELASRSGVRYLLATTQGNFGTLLFTAGDYETALRYQEGALKVFPAHSDNYIGSLDNQARTKLAQGKLDECEALLDKITVEKRFLESETSYVYRHALLTRVQFLSRVDRLNEAVTVVDHVIRLASAAADSMLFHTAVLTKAELLVAAGRLRDFNQTVELIGTTISLQPPDTYAFYQSVVARAIAATGDVAVASRHLSRAKRIYENLSHGSALGELERSSSALVANQALGNESPAMVDWTSHVVHELTTLLLHAQRPELLARDLIELIVITGCVTRATAIHRRADGFNEIHASVGSEDNVDGTEQCLTIGGYRDGVIEVHVWLNQGPKSLVIFNSFRHLVEVIRELDRSRTEREARAALWPVEDTGAAYDRFVITGHMRELINQARKIATTTVNVLITGESGTGKEILARAIHDFSDRAQKPFVTFNCAAIPRDLLESQLFGHRRGAFTGADRDQLGIIRAARDGTLFLDEVGELGLDLQPKILRFLESGEIAPLGEPGTMNVNVRIVAATNTKLEDAVRAGRFREDLYYRLNVVHLTIRPLRERRDEIPGLVQHFVARAAEEFKKGRLEVAEETMERLILYRWPGNVRQLQNELRRMVALAEPDSVLTPEMIAEPILDALPFARPAHVSNGEIAVPLHSKLMPTLARVEGEMIRAAWSQHHGKVEAVAKALGISRKGLYLKRQRLGL